MNKSEKKIWDLQKKHFCLNCCDIITAFKVKADNDIEFQRRIQEEEQKREFMLYPYGIKYIAFRYFHTDFLRIRKRIYLNLLR